MCQYSLTAEQLKDAQSLLCRWQCEFELLYYQLKECHIHFVCPAVHQVAHLVPEVIQKGPPICYAQWTMECTIGNLGQQIRQPSKPFTNLAREEVWCCQVNALISLIPELDDSPQAVPRGAVDLGGGYVLCCKCAKHPISPDAELTQAIQLLLGSDQAVPCIIKWAWLCLPNGQVAQSLWKESDHLDQQLCISRNVKLLFQGSICVGEVQYYAQIPTDKEGGNWSFQTIAIIKLFSPPDVELLKQSSQVLATSTLLNQLTIVNVESIQSVVAMIPHKLALLSHGEERVDCFCMVEKSGLDVSDLGVPYSLDQEEDDNEDSLE
ncbi:hypothetical protein J3R82DRAFT_5037 [Butyriboletus roseoflavus]|nr:hypothetical protein J3R82DRAFT_5037 [Butyriboletus roseoflavus]